MFLQHIQRSKIAFTLLFIAGMYSQNIFSEVTKNG